MAEGEALETLTGDEEGGRLDVFLSHGLGVTRSFAQRLLKEGRVEGPGGRLRPAAKVLPGAAYRVALPEPEGMEIEPEPAAFGVVYEDRDLAVIDPAKCTNCGLCAQKCPAKCIETGQSLAACAKTA